jgi:acyl-CoA hydrolase
MRGSLARGRVTLLPRTYWGAARYLQAIACDVAIAHVAPPNADGLCSLGATPRLHSINSALEVDLFGQVNVEWQGSALSSGVGGGPDFMRAATFSPGGRSIIALPATAERGMVSRIVARLARPSVSVARSDIDTVVTEHGVAELRDKGIDERAQALITVAAPQFRAELEEEWRALRATFG